MVDGSDGYMGQMVVVVVVVAANHRNQKSYLFVKHRSRMVDGADETYYHLHCHFLCLMECDSLSIEDCHKTAEASYSDFQPSLTILFHFIRDQKVCILIHDDTTKSHLN